MDWFRMYHEARRDAKLALLSDAQFRVWFNLMCLAAEQTERGTISGYDDFRLALEVARGDEALLATTRAFLIRASILTADGETLRFVHWHERQYEKPSDRPKKVAERVARHRASKAAAAADHDPEPVDDATAADPRDDGALPGVTEALQGVTPRYTALQGALHLCARTENRVQSTEGETIGDLEQQQETPPPADTPRVRARDRGWEVLSAFCGFEPKDKSERAIRGKVLRHLRTDLDATDEQIARACQAYIERWPEIERTATALGKHFERLLQTPARASPKGSAWNGEKNGVDWIREMQTEAQGAGRRSQETHDRDRGDLPELSAQ